MKQVKGCEDSEFSVCSFSVLYVHEELGENTGGFKGW
jgi:hypothetical protein